MGIQLLNRQCCSLGNKRHTQGMAHGLRYLKREATGRALAQAAFELTRERGLFGFVTADVVQRAGYSRRTFANHFSCKEEAVASVAFGGVEDASAILAGLPADLPLLDALLAVMRDQFTADTLVRMRELMAMAREYPTLEPYVLGVQQRMRHAAQELLGSVAGDRYPAIYVPLLFGAVYGAVMAALEGTLDVHLDGESEASAASMDYGSFLDLTFDYLRHGL
jgi:AcrR family transcriptional regulator